MYTWESFLLSFFCEVLVEANNPKITSKDDLVEGIEELKDRQMINKRLFEALDSENKGKIRFHELQFELEHRGLLYDDPRLKHLFSKLKFKDEINAGSFADALESTSVLIERALTGNLVIPEFGKFCEEIRNIYEDTLEISRGKVADYIPQLAEVDPSKYAISVCTIDGQRFSIGDHTEEFSIQSTSKPINYLLALQENGEEFVHKHVGREPSGHSFNEITLDKEGRPHNPMINAGAIVCSSLIKSSASPAERFNYVNKAWTRLCGGNKPNFNNGVFLSEKQTADRNFALAYFMREHNAFPFGTNIQETLDFYFQCCSLEMSSDAFSVAAATLANAGFCPLTGEEVFQASHIKDCLSLMYSCGMYDFSGEWAFSIGLPAKSGVGGGLMIIIPNVMGIGIWSPPLDELGNTVRGIEFAQKLIQKFNFHNYDSLVANNNKKEDPRCKKYESRQETVLALCWAASQGDLNEIQRLIARGVDLDIGDYDGRTAIHLAASEGHYSVVEFLLNKGAKPNPKDRWGGTPLDDAKREGHQNVVELFKKLMDKN